MIFGEKTSLRPAKCFSGADLLEYVDSLVRETSSQERRALEKSNYRWLTSKHREAENKVDHCLEELRPLVEKIPSEACTAIAVKIDHLTLESTVTSHTIIAAFKNLLEEHSSAQLMAENFKRYKGGSKRYKEGRRVNKVHPELSPPGRQATVCFIVE